MAKRWSESEIQFIKDNYETLSDTGIGEKIGIWGRGL